MFRGTFERKGIRTMQGGRKAIRTVLVTDVTDEKGAPLCDHAWINAGRKAVRLKAQKGDLIEFYTLIIAYQRRRWLGNRWRMEWDYGFGYPTRIRRIMRREKREGN